MMFFTVQRARVYGAEESYFTLCPLIRVCLNPICLNGRATIPESETFHTRHEVPRVTKETTYTHLLPVDLGLGLFSQGCPYP